jgi:type IV pilus assembly protein PilB
MVLNDQLRQLIMENSPADEIRNVAKDLGMIPLRGYGMQFVYDGVTTLDEVMRETVLDA